MTQTAHKNEIVSTAQRTDLTQIKSKMKATWEDGETVIQRLSGHFTDIQLSRKSYPQWHYSITAPELVDLFRRCFGPVKHAFETIDEKAGKALHRELAQIYNDSSESANGTLTITAGEYLEVIATRR